MEISVQPHELAAAAAALTGCARDLSAALDGFMRSGSAAAVGLGMRTIEATDRGLQLTDRAVRIMVADIDRLAAGLRAVAERYPAVDAAGVLRP